MKPIGDHRTVTWLDEHSLHAWIDCISPKLRQHAQDYLTEDRLVRRIRRGWALYTAELRGYQDTYRPRATVQNDVWDVGCTCARRHMPCSHAVALMLDLSRFFSEYVEAPWNLVVQAQQVMADWPFDQNFPWQHVPTVTPFWRKPFTPADLTKLTVLLSGASVSRLAQDPAIPLWAELHPTWINHPIVYRLWDEWLTRHLNPLPSDAVLWVTLHWMQPNLPLSPVFLALSPWPTATAIFQQLWNPAPLIVATPDRQRALLADLTLVLPDLGNSLWPLFRDIDPHALAQADAAYLAGHRQKAIQLLDQDLPSDPKARRDVRLRLINWLDPKASVPHRLALAWESGSITYVEPIRSFLTDRDWDLLIQALNEKRRAAPSEDVPQ